MKAGVSSPSSDWALIEGFDSASGVFRFLALSALRRRLRAFANQFLTCFSDSFVAIAKFVTSCVHPHVSGSGLDGETENDASF